MYYAPSPDHEDESAMLYHFETHTNDELATWVQTNLSQFGSYGYIQSRITECENHEKSNLFVKFLQLFYDLDFEITATQLEYEQQIDQYILKNVTLMFLILFENECFC